MKEGASILFRIDQIDLRVDVVRLAPATAGGIAPLGEAGAAVGVLVAGGSADGLLAAQDCPINVGA